jgi:hypothetical protein
MADRQRRLILGYGERYVQGIEKPRPGRGTEPPRSYDDARELVKKGLTDALTEFRSLPKAKKLPDEAIFCLRLHPDATAKTYEPSAIFADVPELRNVGSRTYRTSIDHVAQTKRIEKKLEKDEEEVSGRLVFVQGSEDGFERFFRHLDRPTSQVSRPFQDAVRRVERLDTLSVSEQIHGFSEKWQEGRVELIFHPSRKGIERQLSSYSSSLMRLALTVKTVAFDPILEGRLLFRAASRERC